MGITTVMAGAEAWSAEGSGARASVGVAVIHGFTGNPIATRPVGERLNAEGWTVDVPRLPGHGTSWLDMSRTRYDDWLGTVAETVDRLLARCDRVSVVGLSMGGTLTLDVATRRPDDLASIAVINPSLLPRDGFLPKLAPVLQYLLPVAPRDLADLPTGDIAKEGADEHAYAFIPMMSAYSLVKGQGQIHARLDRLTMPVFVAWSPQDHSVPPKNSEWLVEQLADRDLTTLKCERSYHVVTLDHDAELLNDALVEFVARTTDN